MTFTLEQLLQSNMPGFFFGILASVLAWYIVSKIFVPRIKISPKISKIPDSTNGNYKYRIKIYNAGCRAAFEFSIVAEIRFKKKDGTANIQLMRIGINSVPLAFLDSKKGRTMNLKTESIPEHHQRHLSDELKNRIQSGERVSLEEILTYLGPDSYVRVYVMCNDGTSGARKYFVSPDYSIADIVNIGFDPKSEQMMPDGVI